jgi:hypothetical protein
LDVKESLPATPWGNSSEQIDGSQLLTAWIRLSRQRGWFGSEGRPPARALAKQGAAAKRLAEQYTAAQCAALFVGMEATFPYAPPPDGRGDPWDLMDAERKATKAIAAAANHPEIRRRREDAEWDALLDAEAAA